MTKIFFNIEEVQAYLEYKLTHGEANEDETELYEELQWRGTVNKNKLVYKRLVMEMRNHYYKGE